MKSLRSGEGYLMIDHRTSPGMPAEVLQKAGVNAPAVGEGAVFECATLGCAHCGAVVMVNPTRTRERGYCSKCDRYICDHCKAATLEATYVHRPFKQIVDMVKSGRYTVSGSASSPILILKKGT